MKQNYFKKDSENRIKINDKKKKNTSTMNHKLSKIQIWSYNTNHLIESKQYFKKTDSLGERN